MKDKLKEEIATLIYRKQNRFNEIGELSKGSRTFNERLQRTIIKNVGRSKLKDVRLKDLK